MSRYEVIPYVVQGDRATLPVAVLAEVFDELRASGRLRQTWHNGGMEDLGAFLEFFGRPGVLASFVVDADERRVCFVGWLTEVRDHTAKVHFTAVGPFRLGAARAILAQWDSWGLFRVLVGITPETYSDALRVTKIMGFERVGTIPELCNLVYEGRRVGGVVTYRKGC